MHDEIPWLLLQGALVWKTIVAGGVLFGMAGWPLRRVWTRRVARKAIPGPIGSLTSEAVGEAIVLEGMLTAPLADASPTTPTCLRTPEGLVRLEGPENKVVGNVPQPLLADARVRVRGVLRRVASDNADDYRSPASQSALEAPEDGALLFAALRDEPRRSWPWTLAAAAVGPVLVYYALIGIGTCALAQTPMFPDLEFRGADEATKDIFATSTAVAVAAATPLRGEALGHALDAYRSPIDGNSPRPDALYFSLVDLAGHCDEKEISRWRASTVDPRWAGHCPEELFAAREVAAQLEQGEVEPWVAFWASRLVPYPEYSERYQDREQLAAAILVGALDAAGKGTASLTESARRACAEGDARACEDASAWRCIGLGIRVADGEKVSGLRQAFEDNPHRACAVLLADALPHDQRRAFFEEHAELLHTTWDRGNLLAGLAAEAGVDVSGATWQVSRPRGLVHAMGPDFQGPYKAPILGLEYALFKNDQADPRAKLHAGMSLLGLSAITGDLEGAAAILERCRGIASEIEPQDESTKEVLAPYTVRLAWRRGEGPLPSDWIERNRARAEEVAAGGVPLLKESSFPSLFHLEDLARTLAYRADVSAKGLAPVVQTWPTLTDGAPGNLVRPLDQVLSLAVRNINLRIYLGERLGDESEAASLKKAGERLRGLLTQRDRAVLARVAAHHLR